MATAERVLSYARAELGKTEAPAGSNRTPYGKWFGLDGQPWCMMFVQWVFAQAGMPLPYKTASCSALLDWCRKNRPGSVCKTPQTGDVVIYRFGHTGIVESVGSGFITAIEGNTSPGTAGSQDNGGMVCRRTRKSSTVTAYIRPDYEKYEKYEKKEDKPMNNTPSPAHKEGVEWAKKNGILTGDASGDLKLTEPVTRQQMCTMLYRMAKKMGNA